MCLVAFQKIFRKIFSGVWKRRRKTQIQKNTSHNLENTNPENTNPENTIAISPTRSHEGEIVIDTSRDRAVNRDLAKARSRSTARSREQRFARSRSTLPEIAIDGAWRSAGTGARIGLLLSHARALSLSLFFQKSFEVKIEVVIDIRC